MKNNIITELGSGCSEPSVGLFQQNIVEYYSDPLVWSAIEEILAVGVWQVVLRISRRKEPTGSSPIRTSNVIGAMFVLSAKVVVHQELS